MEAHKMVLEGEPRRQVDLEYQMTRTYMFTPQLNNRAVSW
jgi:hypothetical protein